MEQNSSFLEETKSEEKKVRKTRTKKADIPITPSTDVVVTEDTITQELAKHNITEALLLEMETNFMPLTIAGPEDKEGYLAVHNARIAVKNTRVLGVKLCKEGRAEAIKIQKGWINAEDKFETRMKKMEDVLAERQKVIDDIKEAEKLERDTKDQARLNERAVKLIGLGMIFDGVSSYVLDDVRISVVQVKQLDEFVFGQLLAGVETKFRENQEIKKREEELRLQAEAANKLILEETLAKQEELKLKEQAIAAREEAIKAAEAKAKLEAENKIREEELALKQKAEAILQQKEKEEQEQFRTRKSALFQLGFSQQNDHLVFKSLGITEHNIKNLNPSEWSAVILDFTVESNKIKEQLEKDRIAREEQIKAEAIAAEKKRAEDAAYADAIAAKEKAEVLAKEQARLDQLKPDDGKLTDYLKALFAVPMPVFTTEAFKNYLPLIETTKKAFLAQIHNSKPK